MERHSRVSTLLSKIGPNGTLLSWHLPWWSYRPGGKCRVRLKVRKSLKSTYLTSMLDQLVGGIIFPMVDHQSILHHFLKIGNWMSKISGSRLSVSSCISCLLSPISELTHPGKVFLAGTSEEHLLRYLHLPSQLQQLAFRLVDAWMSKCNEYLSQHEVVPW